MALVKMPQVKSNRPLTLWEQYMQQAARRGAPKRGGLQDVRTAALGSRSATSATPAAPAAPSQTAAPPALVNAVTQPPPPAPPAAPATPAFDPNGFQIDPLTLAMIDSYAGGYFDQPMVLSVPQTTVPAPAPVAPATAPSIGANVAAAVKALNPSTAPMDIGKAQPTPLLTPTDSPAPVSYGNDTKVTELTPEEAAKIKAAKTTPAPAPTAPNTLATRPAGTQLNTSVDVLKSKATPAPVQPGLQAPVVASQTNPFPAVIGDSNGIPGAARRAIMQGQSTIKMPSYYDIIGATPPSGAPAASAPPAKPASTATGTLQKVTSVDKVTPTKTPVGNDTKITEIPQPSTKLSKITSGDVR